MNTCLKCGTQTKNNKFCSSSCAAKYNNTGRIVSESSNKKRSIKLKGQYRGKPAAELFINQIAGPYTKIYLRTCKFSGMKWYSKSIEQIHPSLKSEYQKYSYACKFTFSINDYPEWFNNASELITKYGWYASSSKTHPGISNRNGISRDHRISVNYGFTNKIDPFIISHPANCVLMPHLENSSKNKQCSITINELYNDIEKFDRLYHTALATIQVL